MGLSNVNGWILFVTYGLCFGVELIMNNKVVLYFYRYHAVNPQMAGILGACFSLTNLFARSWGGWLSDRAHSRYGVRGRIWAMWIVQTAEGIVCLLLGLVTIQMPGPDDDPGRRTQGAFFGGGLDEPLLINGSVGEVVACGSELIANPRAGHLLFSGAASHVPTDEAFVMIRDPNPECVCNASSLASVMVILILFSILVQAQILFNTPPKSTTP